MISALFYSPKYISVTEEIDLIDIIDQQIWLSPFQRRVQHYGYMYDYKKRTVTDDMYLGALPKWLDNIARQLHKDGYIDAVPDQVIINEYNPGQGIASHIDCEPCFGDTILSLSLGSTCIMNFHQVNSETLYQQVLEPRSLVIMKKDARYLWKHGISARKSDKINGVVVKRKRRLSLTFRKIINTHSK